ncbi:hypothetical protein BDZ45DRAFT_744920 [Acephala macrosclerotiorum]|nr:hypothetical protein BDZ45DRAFT_744920 [Acephala macrosclerotiorum]
MEADTNIEEGAETEKEGGVWDELDIEEKMDIHKETGTEETACERRAITKETELERETDSGPASYNASDNEYTDEQGSVPSEDTDLGMFGGGGDLPPNVPLMLLLDSHAGATMGGSG